jgi:hypothetical protein
MAFVCANREIGVPGCAVRREVNKKTVLIEWNTREVLVD